MKFSLALLAVHHLLSLRFHSGAPGGCCLPWCAWTNRYVEAEREERERGQGEGKGQGRQGTREGGREGGRAGRAGRGREGKARQGRARRRGGKGRR